MEIESFKEKDLQDAILLSINAWGSLFPDECEEFVSLMNEHLVRYNYLDPNFSFKITEDGVMQGFLFAAGINATNNSRDWLLSKMQTLSDKEKSIAQEGMNYYKNNSARVAEVFQNDGILLTLFVSDKKGCGRLLMENFIHKCAKEGIANVYLWTDTTCNHQYYEQNDFTLVSQFESQELTDMGEGFQTFIYKKKIIVAQ